MCVLCASAVKAHIVSTVMCAPLSIPTTTQAGGLWIGLFFLAALSSPVATKLPGPHWVWFLTSSPSSSAGFFYIHFRDWFCPSWTPTSATTFLPPSLLYRNFFQAVASDLPRPLISPLPSPSLTTFLKLPAHFIHSFFRATVEPCCMPDSVPRIPEMHWGSPSFRGTNKIIAQNCSCPGLGIITELSRGSQRSLESVLPLAQDHLGSSVPLEGM